jgi:hypothetical protein
MNHLKSTLLASVFVLFFALDMVAGGGWVKSKGTGYYKFGFSTVNSIGYFDGGSVYNPLLDSRVSTASFYTEHGIGDGLSFELFLPLYTRHSVSGSRLEENGDFTPVEDAVGGVGDVNFGLRFRILEQSFLTISGTAMLGIPVGSAEKGERNNLFTGDDEFNQTLRFDASVPYGTDALSGYSTLYGGINKRGEPFSDEWLYGFETGISHKKSRVWLIGRLQAIKAQNEDPREFSNGFTSSMSFTNYSVQATYGLTDKHGFSVSYTGSVSGNVLLVAPAYSIGLYMNIN